MDRSSSRHHRPEISSQTLESMVLPTNTNPHNQETKKLSNRPQEQEPQKCPRCDSTNTKFCYYNNYSLSQPRYFCKSCRRYWTRGGTLRNVPVGGGCRKNPKKSSPSATKRVPMDQENGPVFPNPIHSFPEPFLGYFDEYDQGVFKADSRVTHLGDLGMGNISGFFEAPNSEFFQSLCYGNIGNMVGMVENGGQERGLAFGYMSGGGGGGGATTAAAAAVKQEVWGGGYPWEGMIGGDGNGLVGGGGSSWQRGLLNSPLM